MVCFIKPVFVKLLPPCKYAAQGCNKIHTKVIFHKEKSSGITAVVTHNKHPIAGFRPGEPW